MHYRNRRTLFMTIVALIAAISIIFNGDMTTPDTEAQSSIVAVSAHGDAAKALGELAIKGRAPKTGYSRDMFGDGWATTDGCDTRDIILNRDLENPAVGDDCKVISGILHDPYTGKIIEFWRGPATSADVQIDHVVALSDAWQTGAQQLSYDKRVQLANDPLELLAVDGPANQQKSGSDAASWLPSYKPFRCQYVARQIAVKQKYSLWVTATEHDAILAVLSRCPAQELPRI